MDKSMNKKDNLIWKVPDGGWGWVIVLGTTIIMVLSSNLHLSYGVMFSRWYETHDVSSTLIGITFNINAFLFNLMFLLIGPLTEQFGWRQIGMLSNFMVALAIILSSFASSITHILFSYSILGGIFGGLTVSQLYTILPKYFDKRLGVASAFPMAAYPLCQFIFPIFIPYLQEQYGFNGSMLILGGIMLNSVAAAALFQPPECHRLRIQKCDSKVNSLKQNNIGACKLSKDTIGVSWYKDNSNVVGGYTTNNIENRDITENDLPVNYVNENDFQVGSLAEDDITTGVQKETNNVFSGLSKKSVRVIGNKEIQFGAGVTVIKENNIGVSRKAENGAEVSELREKETEEIYFDNKIDQTNPVKFREKSIFKKGSATIGCVLKSARKNLLVLNKPSALILSLSFSVFLSSTLNFNAFVTFIIVNEGHSLEDAGLVLSYGAIANVIARFSGNALSDFEWFKIPIAYNCGTILSIVGIVGFALSDNYISQSVLFVIQSFGFGMHMGLISLVTKEIVGVENHSASLGASGTLLSIGFLILGSLVGYIKDSLGSYTAALIFIALLNGVSILLWTLMPSAKSYELKKIHKTTDEYHNERFDMQ